MHHISRRLPLRLATAAFLLALAARLAFVCIVAPLISLRVGPANPSYYSCDGYQAIAKMLASGHGFRFEQNAPLSVFRAPLYPVILAIFYKITGGSEIAVLLQNLLFGSLGCSLCVIAAYRIFGRRVAILTAVGVAFFPQFLLYTWSIFTESVQFFFVSLMVLCLVYMFERRSVKWGIASGVSLGLAVLSKGYLLGFPVFLIPALLLTKNPNDGCNGISGCSLDNSQLYGVRPYNPCDYW